ncbi:PipA/GogA/GtgA family type III secretion system effector [Pseudomonas typographi]|uniref:PipA/GogA/GtgA family type III secretion system effector n=1 Tax=Pseudomonas typographi TaxID=2715964 RepID=A0ABR7Z4S2_9PSED|nr:PipA/GogA/GtgA family type III secretion system effector [Pseudomonas typographi]MBD1600348.1 PipA/GogA/GtgA family type III secretion system effector [Pseudomonas typographi]
MLFPLQVTARPAPAEPQLSAPPKDTDQQLAERHGDMHAQLKNPSAMRRQHDMQAIDDGPQLELARLGDYLVRADSRAVDGKPDDYRKAMATLNETLVRAYERSPTFRRLYNHAVQNGVLSLEGRYALTLARPLGDGRRSTPLLIDGKEPGKQPHRSARSYRSASGERASSSKRVLLEQILSAVTRLPSTESKHPRGPIQEYANIILKEQGERAEPALVAQLEDAPPSRSPNGRSASPRAVLNSVLMTHNLASDNGAQPPGRERFQRAKAELNIVAQARLEAIANRPRPNRPDLQQLIQIDQQNAKALVPTLSRLLVGMDGTESPLGLLEKMARQNARQKLFTYRMDKAREPFEMVARRDGDCSSFAKIFNMVGQAAGIKGLRPVELEGAMKFTLSATPELSNWAAGAPLEFARHTILAIENEDDTGPDIHFDPVFGCQVDPEQYGKDADRYLMRA